MLLPLSGSSKNSGMIKQVRDYESLFIIPNGTNERERNPRIATPFIYIKLSFKLLLERQCLVEVQGDLFYHEANKMCVKGQRGWVFIKRKDARESSEDACKFGNITRN